MSLLGRMLVLIGVSCLGRWCGSEFLQRVAQVILEQSDDLQRQYGNLGKTIPVHGCLYLEL